MRDPLGILNDPATRDVLDFTKPIALVLVAVLHFIGDEDKPGEIVATVLDALPSGSYLLASHSTGNTTGTAVPVPCAPTGSGE